MRHGKTIGSFLTFSVRIDTLRRYSYAILRSLEDIHRGSSSGERKGIGKEFVTMYQVS